MVYYRGNKVKTKSLNQQRQRQNWHTPAILLAEIWPNFITDLQKKMMLLNLSKSSSLTTLGPSQMGTGRVPILVKA